MGQETVVQIRLFPLWIYKVVILKKGDTNFKMKCWLTVMPVTFQISPQWLSTAWNEVDLSRIFRGQLWLNWIAFLKKARRTLAANYLIKTKFLTFWFSGCLAIGTRDFQKLCKYSSLANMVAQMCTFNIGHPVFCWTYCFRYCDNCYWSTVYHRTGLITLLHQDIASPPGARFVTINLLFLTN